VISTPSSPSTPQRPYLRSMDTQSAPGSPYRRRQRLLPEETSIPTGRGPDSEGDPWGSEEPLSETLPDPHTEVGPTQARSPSTPPPPSPQDLFLSLAHLPTAFNPLSAATAASFCSAAARLAESFLSNPSDDALLDFLALPKVGLVPALKRGRGIRERFERYPRVDWPEPEAREDRGRSGRGPSVTKQVEMGRLGSAARILLGKSAVATVTESVVESLRAKYPAGPPLPFGTTAGPRNGEIPPEDTLLAAFKSFKPDTAPGISGWTHHLLAVPLRYPVVLKALHTLTGLIAAGTAPGQSMLCSSRLTALLKPGGGYRPIAMGELVYRLCTKAILRHSFRLDFLLPFQFGVGTEGGVEPVIRVAQRALDDSLCQFFTHFTSLDFSNAFNTMDRREIASGLRRFAPSLYRAGRWAYGTPSDLVFVRRRTGIGTPCTARGLAHRAPHGDWDIVHRTGIGTPCTARERGVLCA
jgi:hypothetical protein